MIPRPRVNSRIESSTALELPSAECHSSDTSTISGLTNQVNGEDAAVRHQYSSFPRGRHSDPVPEPRAGSSADTRAFFSEAVLARPSMNVAGAIGKLVIANRVEIVSGPRS